MKNEKKIFCLQKAIKAMELNTEPHVNDFFGVAGLYGVDVVELATMYFKKISEEA